MLGTATFRLENSGEEIKSRELYQVEENNHPRLPPLFGQFCARLAVMPYCREEPVLVEALGVRAGEARGIQVAGGLLGRTHGLEAESVVGSGPVRGSQVTEQDCQD